MPRNDQTGPNGEGPMTGRRMGVCVGNQKQESFFNLRLGRGFRGRRNMRFNPVRNNSGFTQKEQYSKTSSKDLIESEIENLKQRLHYLEGELENLS